MLDLAIPNKLLLAKGEKQYEKRLTFGKIINYAAVPLHFLFQFPLRNAFSIDGNLTVSTLGSSTANNFGDCNPVALDKVFLD